VIFGCHWKNLDLGYPVYVLPLNVADFGYPVYVLPLNVADFGYPVYAIWFSCSQDCF
jgi:hypothetical protein